MSPVNLYVIRLLAYGAGAILSVLAVVLMAGKHRRTAGDWLLLGWLAALGLWQAAHAGRLFLGVAGEPAARRGALQAVTENGHPVMGGLAWVAAAVAAAWLFSGRRAAAERRFFAWFGASLAAMAALALGGPDSTLLALAALAPPFCLVWFAQHSNALDLLVSRRLLFVFTLASVSALYLMAVRTLAGWAESQFDTFGPLIEVSLILGAAITWLPLYEWIARFFSRPAAIYSDFGKRVIEEAARILDLPHRARYLLEQVARTFRLKRAALVLCEEPPRVLEYGPQTGALAEEDLCGLARQAAEARLEVMHVRRLADFPQREILERHGFNYVFPLRYEEHASGLLFLDTSPRVFLDENEAVLLALCRQISLSIESCRLMESKIQLERELLRQEQLATLGKAAATIAHEVRNPLSSIKTLAQLLQEDPAVAGAYSRDLNYMVAETDRLNACVQQLLTFSRPAPESEGELALSELLESAGEMMARESAKQNVRLARRIQPGLKLAGGGGQTVQQIVLNLVLNAVQASSPGDTVQLESGMDGGKVWFRVTDQGPGVPKEIRERIFEPFFTTRQKGTGLGLAIVRKNVRMLDGELKLETPVAAGRGTSVTVTLPAG